MLRLYYFLQRRKHVKTSFFGQHGGLGNFLFVAEKKENIIKCYDWRSCGVSSVWLITVNDVIFIKLQLNCELQQSPSGGYFQSNSCFPIFNLKISNWRNCLIDQKLVRVREFASFISQEAEGGGGYLPVGSLPSSQWAGGEMGSPNLLLLHLCFQPSRLTWSLRSPSILSSSWVG